MVKAIDSPQGDQADDHPAAAAARTSHTGRSRA
jgi:hypothetical protein